MNRRFAVALSLTLLAAPAARALQQPNGVTIPTPPGCSGNQPNGLAATFACVCTMPGVCNIGASCPGGQMNCDPGTNGTCETTLWHSPNDNSCIPSNSSGLDVQKEASTAPETFHPTCPLTFTVVTRGQAIFGNAFGWYNVVPGAAPSPNDLHAMLDCKAKAKDQVVLDVKNEPAWKGGDIGFFLVTPEDHNQTGKCAGGDCCATVDRANQGAGWVYFSERKYNPDAMNANPYIHLLIYNSHLVPRKFYFAWEDIFGGQDDEFTDLVTSVQGVECSGAGADCATGMKGICGLGVTHCENGMLQCQQLYQSKSEVCNGLDDDCDGVVDNGATCGGGDVCWNGECVPHCQQSEFACATDYQCDPNTGLCTDPTCAAVTCPPDQICHMGKCGAACDGITCPHGQVCRLGNCIDPCAGVTCGNGLLCSQGFCVPGCASCDGLQCAQGLQCDAKSGNCVDPSCAMACPPGTWCASGACKDACDGAVCPRGFVCMGGSCVVMGNSMMADGGIPQAGADLAVHGGGGHDGYVTPRRAAPGCSCTVGGPSGGRLAFVIALALVWLLARRRRS